MRRGPLHVLVSAALAAAALAEDPAPADTAVATANGVVVHGVDTKLLAARLRDTDRKALAGDARGAGEDLAEILTGDVADLIEDGDSAYLSAREAALQRLAALPPEGLARYRELVDPHAKALLDAAVARADAAALAAEAPRMALSTWGPRLYVTLADLRAARGDLAAAGQALSDLLRLWPDRGGTAEMPGVARADVIERLAVVCAAVGDEATVRWLLRDTGAELLATRTAAAPDVTLRDTLTRLAAAARRTPEAGPRGPLAVAAELVYARERVGDVEGAVSRHVQEHAIPIGTPERPALLTREPTRPRNDTSVVALVPGTVATGALTRLWQWPSVEERKSRLRRGGSGPFLPARCGDVVLFAWPRAPESQVSSGERFASFDERNSLVALSIAAEGRLVDERGADEARRDDADMELETLSFVGRPLVRGDTIYTTLVRRTENGSATQLHLARFDLVADGPGRKLIRRWRTPVLDGIAMPPVRYDADRSNPDEFEEEPLAVPSALAERWGRVYVCSNTGAVACLDGGSGRTLWAQAYQRFGPPIRAAASPAVQRTWGDVPVCADGPYVWAAPRDAEFLLQFRDMPRLARTTLLETLRFHGGSGTSVLSGQLLPNLRPEEVVAVADGFAWLAGRVEGSRIGALVPAGSPLARFRLREPLPGEPRRGAVYAQIAEPGACGSPAVAAGAILFPTTKSIYRVPLDDFESAPQALWKPDAPSRGTPTPDRIGTLVPDGERLWSVTPHRVVLFDGVR